MFKKMLNIRSLCLSGVIAALYAALTLLLAPISFGAVQCRIAEAMALLPVLMPQAIPGLFVGCLIANLYTGSLVDIVFGALATLLAAICTYLLRRKPLLAAACPVVINAVAVGAVLSVTQGWPLPLTMLQIALGECGAAAVGLVLTGALKKARIDFSKL